MLFRSPAAAAKPRPLSRRWRRSPGMEDRLAPHDTRRDSARPAASTRPARGRPARRGPRAGSARSDSSPAGTSIPAEPSPTVAMEICVTEGLCRRPRPLQEEPDLMFVGHANATVHLHAFVRHQDRRVRATGLRQRDRLPRVCTPCIHRTRGGHHAGTRQLDLDVDLRRPVLERLEGADGHAELLAGLQVFHGHLEGLVHATVKGLKTPVENAQNLTVLLKKDFAAILPQKASTYIDRMSYNLHHIDGQINDLVELSRLNFQRLKFKEFASIELVESIFKSMPGLLSKNQVRITFDEKLPRIVADYESIKRVFFGLITNAIKATERVENPAIEIGCKEYSSSFEFYIKDNGKDYSDIIFLKSKYDIDYLFKIIEILKRNRGILRNQLKYYKWDRLSITDI